MTKSTYEYVLTQAQRDEWINLGRLDRSSARDSDNRKVYGIDYDINNRLCLCAIGFPQHMEAKKRAHDYA